MFFNNVAVNKVKRSCVKIILSKTHPYFVGELNFDTTPFICFR